MKRFIILVLTLFTLVMALSACSSNTYNPQKICATVTFRAKDYHCKGDFLFEKDGIKRFTISEPTIINGSFAEEANGILMLSYDDVSEEINDNSPLKSLFVIANDFTSREHKIANKGIEIIKGITEEGTYEIEFDCSEKRIVKIKAEETEYIFQ